MLPFAAASPSRSCRYPSGCSLSPQVTPRERVEHKSGAPWPARGATIPVSALEHWRSDLLVPSSVPGHFPVVLLSVTGGTPRPFLLTFSFPSGTSSLPLPASEAGNPLEVPSYQGPLVPYSSQGLFSLQRLRNPSFPRRTVYETSNSLLRASLISVYPPSEIWIPCFISL